MRWSGLKARIEATFAPSLCGRAEVFVTRYHRASDDAGEAWISFDGERIAFMGEFSHSRDRHPIEQMVAAEAEAAGRPSNAREIQWEVARRTHESGVFSDEEFKTSLFDYLNLSIDGILASRNTIIRAFGMLDARFGKRRLRTFDGANEPELVRQLHAIRCAAERVDPSRGPK